MEKKTTHMAQNSESASSLCADEIGKLWLDHDATHDEMTALIQAVVDSEIERVRKKYEALAEKWKVIAPEMEERTTYLILAHELKALAPNKEGNL